MNNLSHWTHQSTADFVYSISSSFVSQLEIRMEEKDISKTALAERLHVSSGRISQVYNNPGNLSLRVIVEHARALGMKVGIIAYDDGDPENHDGPINPSVFVKSWETLDSPRDLFEVAEKGMQCVGMYWNDASVLYGNQYAVTGNLAGGYQVALRNLLGPFSVFKEPQEDPMVTFKTALATQQPTKNVPHLVWAGQGLQQ